MIQYKPIVDEAVKMCKHIENPHKSIKRIIVQRKDKFEEKTCDKDVYFDYDTLMEDENEIAPCTFVESTHPLYILCTNFSINLIRHLGNHRCP